MIFDALSYITIGIVLLGGLYIVGILVYEDIKSGHFWDTNTGQLIIAISVIVGIGWTLVCAINIISKLV